MEASAKFCGACGAGVMPTAPNSDASPVLATAGSHVIPSRRTLSTPKAILFTLGITLALVVVALFDEQAGKALGALVVFCTSLWIAFDSSRIKIRQYCTRLSGHPVALFFGAYILWIVVFPWYLVVRSKIRAGQIERVNREVRGFGFVLGVGLVSLVALIIAALVVTRLVEHGEASEKSSSAKSASQPVAETTPVQPTQPVAGSAPAADGIGETTFTVAPDPNSKDTDPASVNVNIRGKITFLTPRGDDDGPRFQLNSEDGRFQAFLPFPNYTAEPVYRMLADAGSVATVSGLAFKRANGIWFFDAGKTLTITYPKADSVGDQR
jgi:hypothetical protein